MEIIKRKFGDRLYPDDTTYSNGFGDSVQCLREKLNQMCDVFEYIVKLDDAKESRIWGRDVLSDTAKRLIDKEVEFISSLADKLKHISDPQMPEQIKEGKVSEKVMLYAKLTQEVLHAVTMAKEDIIIELREKTKAETKLSSENMALRVDLRREQAESMQQRQNHGYAVAEKNTALATCRKLEEQLEERAKVIRQLQREGTIALWKREKQKILNNLSGRETRLDNDLKDAKEELDDVRYRLQKRIKDLTNQLKIMKMERQYMGSNYLTKAAEKEEIEKLQRELFLKDRALIIAEGEIQKQQQYFVGFITGLSRDYRLMMSRLNIDECRYSRDQKAFVCMLERMLKSTKEGTLTAFRTGLPSHYLGLGVEIKCPPIKKTPLSKSTGNIQKLVSIDKLLNDENIQKPRLSSALVKWREGKDTSTEKAQEILKESLAPDKHPDLVDTKTGLLNVELAKTTFPDLSIEDVNYLLNIFKQFDVNNDWNLDTPELLRAVPDTLGRMATSEEIAEAMREVDDDQSGTIDFFEFVNVYLMLSKGEGEASLFKKKTLKALQKTDGHHSKICTIQ